MRDKIKPVLTPFILAAFYGLAIGQPAHAASCGDQDIRCVGSGQEYSSIQAAANAAQPGDTVVVSAGTYNESVSTVRSGTANDPITFTTDGAVVIKSFDYIDHDHITIDGFEMAGANDGNMMLWNGDHGQLLNNVIHDTGASWNVAIVDGNNFYASGNHYYSSTGPGDDLPVFVIGGNNSLVENNEIGPAKDIDAFRVWGHDNVIRNNYIHDITASSGSSAHMDAIQTFGVNGGQSYNIVFEDNLIDNSNGDFLQMLMTENNNDPDFRDWDIRNNVYIGVSGQANVGIRNVRFYNNTVYDGGESNSLIMYLYDGSGKSDFSGAQIKNNIFIPASNIGSYGGVISVGSSGSNVQVSNNYVAKIGSWGPVSGFSDTNGINGGDPKFANAGAEDFHLLSTSPAIDRGVTLAGVVDDKDGTSRPQGSAYDMGAYEGQGGGCSPCDPTPPPPPVADTLPNVETVWDCTDVQGAASDGSSWELGFTFEPTVDGYATGVRVYGAAGESGEHTIRLWRNSDETLISGPHTVEYSGDGWHAFHLPTPIALTANEAYTIVVSTGEDAEKFYTAVQDPAMSSSGSNGGNITYPVNAAVYSSTIGGFPSSSWQQSNYFRSIIFVAESSSQ